ncbi:hypothetical protein NEUTE1DRAFT_111278 [Neurospora tetrasperma FGSC 2508]|uniref:Uncharacterized protein n=1 Tax=Neurospora tetrasperma (strain FGSC 2508 / ATCC MYA-4615 / P0657) TaxID=510951 RepID=F8MRC6_NEUT8|nr:uncharacterized protein NEUTE1DRAFT_111278 [Neurospora tetrasperma FGSC 2508]EGO56880.1 hypothetical protein NEUTE1DRAFT_111278 [Neurospora tetrasperma FGSC 2508]
MLLNEANNRVYINMLINASLKAIYLSKVILIRRAKGKLRNPGTIRALVRRNYSQYELGPSIKEMDTRREQALRKRILCAHENYVGHAVCGSRIRTTVRVILPSI